MIPHSRPTITKTDIVTVMEQLASGMIAHGEKCCTVESVLEQLFGWEKAVCFSSGKAALIVGLKLLGIGEGDEVILPTYVCRTVYDAIRYVGAKPELVDIEEDYCIDPALVEKSITSDTRAAIVVHPFGIRADVKRIGAICRKHDITMIEDIAQSIAVVDGRPPTGVTADMVFGSFHATKMLASGEGGFLGLRTEGLAATWDKQSLSLDAGANFSDLAASLALSQLSRLEEFTSIRRELTVRYRERLSGVDGVTLPELADSIYFRYPVRIAGKFEEVRSWMERGGVQVRKGVDYLLHWIEQSGKFPVAERMYERTVSLPIYPSLTMEDVDIICDILIKGLKSGFASS